MNVMLSQERTYSLITWLVELPESLRADEQLLLIALLTQGVRVLFYARSDAWKLEKRIRRFVRLDAE